MMDSKGGAGHVPAATVSYSIRFFLIQPANILLGISTIYLLSDALFPIAEARTAMAAGIFGASFGFGNYRDDGGAPFTWRRAVVCLVALNFLGLVAGYLMAVLIMLTGIANAQPWKEILLILPPLIATDFLTPFVARQVASSTKGAPEEKKTTP